MKPLDPYLELWASNMRESASGLLTIAEPAMQNFCNARDTHTDEPEVSLDSLIQLMETVGLMPPPNPKIVVIQFPPPTVTVQARTHRRSRINKKWRKKYGFITIPDRKAIETVIVDKERNIAYVYPEMMERIRKAIAEYKGIIDTDFLNLGGLL